jgi:hypothetical protein
MQGRNFEASSRSHLPDSKPLIVRQIVCGTPIAIAAVGRDGMSPSPVDLHCIDLASACLPRSR